MLHAGAAALDITPSLGVPLAGSFTARYAADVDDPLHARALVLEDEQGAAGRLAIVCCDLICMPGETVRAARSLIGAAGDVPPERVLIASTHTHTAPAPTGLLGTPRADAYMEALPARIATAVAMAARRLRPARAAWASGAVRGVTFNRRFRMRDGTVHMNPGRLNPDALAPAGPVDPELGVLWVEGADGRPIAALASFALHYVGTDNGRHVSADYFGAYARWLQRLWGPEIVPMLLNGTSGDINNVDIHDAAQASGRAQAERVAGALAGETLKLVQQARPTADVTLAACSAPLPFGRKTITAEDLAVAARIEALGEDVPPAEIRSRAGLGGDGPFSWVVGQPLPPSALAAYARECRLLSELPERMETEVQALRVGRCALVSLPGEIFVALGMAIKERSPFRPQNAAYHKDEAVGEHARQEMPVQEQMETSGVTLLASLANDYIGYVPTRRAIEEEGGYETWAARSALPAAGTGEAMVDLASSLLSQLND